VIFSDQVPIPARTGGGSGKDEKSHAIRLFSSREGVFYSLQRRMVSEATKILWIKMTVS
jgi:hypothetical protein